MALVWMEGSVVDVPDELAGSYEPYVPPAAPAPAVRTDFGWTAPTPAPAPVVPAYSGPAMFSEANQFSHPGFYGAAGSVGKMLQDAATQAGMPNYDFNEAASKVAPQGAGFGGGWLLGANEEEIAYKILQATGIPEFQAIAAARSPTTNPAAFATAANAGVQRDADLAQQNASQESDLGDIAGASLPLVLALAFPQLAPALGSLFGATGTAASMIGSGLIGAGTSAVAGGDPLVGGLLGAGGAGLGSLFSSAPAAATASDTLADMGTMGLTSTGAQAGFTGADLLPDFTSFIEPGLTAAAGETGGAVGIGGNAGLGAEQGVLAQAVPQIAPPVVTALPPPPTIAPPVDIANAAGGFTVPSIGSTDPYTGGLSLPSTLGTASPSLGFGITPAAVDAFTPAAAGSFLGAATPEIASGIANAGSTAAGLGGGSFLGGTAPGALTNILSGLGTASGLSSVPIPPGMYVDLNYHNNEMPLAGPATGYDANPESAPPVNLSDEISNSIGWGGTDAVAAAGADPLTTLMQPGATGPISTDNGLSAALAAGPQPISTGGTTLAQLTTPSDITQGISGDSTSMNIFDGINFSDAGQGISDMLDSTATPSYFGSLADELSQSVGWGGSPTNMGVALEDDWGWIDELSQAGSGVETGNVGSVGGSLADEISGAINVGIPQEPPLMDELAGNILTRETAGGDPMGGGAQGNYYQQLLNSLPNMSPEAKALALKALTSAAGVAGTGLSSAALKAVLDGKMPGLDDGGIGGLLQSIFGGSTNGSGTGIFGTNGGTGGYQIDLPGIIGSIAGYKTSQTNADNFNDLAKRLIAASDPFAGQRPQYQSQLQRMMTDPNYWNNDPTIAGANARVVNDTTRSLASQGYNMSGNVPMDVASRLQQQNLPYIQNQQNLMAGLAGANLNPSAGVAAASAAGTAANNALNQGNASLGNLFGSVWNGSQPSLASRALGNSPLNQNLGSVINNLIA